MFSERISDQDLTVWERFAQVARRTPTATALDLGERSLCYAELQTQAISLSSRLASLGMQEAGRVAILAEDRHAAIAAMLGTAHSGHAYVPLDAGDPEERLRLIIEDCSAFALLADAASLDRARALAPTGCVVLELAQLMTMTGSTISESAAKPETLFYINYTSGSTGRPKGVLQTHRHLLFFVDAYSSKLQISAADRLSLLYTLSFSAANMDIYGALLNGACLCPYDMRKLGLPGLPPWLESQRISVLHTVPTVFRELVRGLEPEQIFETMRAVDLGGETLFRNDVARFRSHVGADCRIFNHLAATEASVIAQYEIHPEDEKCSSVLPVGIPPQHVEVHVLRADGSEAARGEIGSIAVDSPYLSPGYWCRPAQDSAAFSSVTGHPGWRRYQGGDLGWLDDSGQLHFSGREGSRIKLRGQSVDLNEVEAALLACEGVLEAAVLPQDGGEGEVSQLIACLVMPSISERVPHVLRSQLTHHLPSYMLPGGYVYLEKLPRTATGKLDRRALSEIELDKHRYRPDFIAPEDDLEQRIADIYSGVLRFAPVGRLDDFFLLGGDSILLVELQLHLRSAFGFEVPDLYRHASVSGLASRIRELAAQSPVKSRLVPLRTQGSAPPLFLVHGRHGHAHVSPHFMALVGEEQPLYALQARGVDGLEPTNATIEEMAADYLQAVRAQQAKGPYFLGALCAGAYVAIEMARLLRKSGEVVLPLLLIDPPAPPFHGSDMQIEDGVLQERMHKMASNGRIKVELNDPHIVQAAMRVRHAFDAALSQYQLMPYAGPVMLISSKIRLSPDQWGTKAKIRQVFSGRVGIFPAEDRHRQMLHPSGRLFGVQLRKCLNLIYQRAGIRLAKPATGSSVDSDSMSETI